MIEISEKLKRYKIDQTDIFLENFEVGQGKIIIANPYYNFSNYWGSMGSSIEEFLLRINSDYFITKLTGHHSTTVFSAKASIKNVRRHIREELAYELPWYKYMSAQKELRERLKEIENEAYSEESFVSLMSNISKTLYCFDLDKYDEAEFRDGVECLTQEPWHFIGTEPSQESIFLEKIFPKLKKVIKKII